MSADAPSGCDDIFDDIQMRMMASDFGISLAHARMLIELNNAVRRCKERPA